MKKKPVKKKAPARPGRLQADVPLGTREILTTLTGMALQVGLWDGKNVRGELVALALALLHQMAGNSPRKLKLLVHGEIDCGAVIPDGVTLDELNTIAMEGEVERRMA